MTRRSRIFIHQLHTNAICLLDHMPVGNDVTLGIYDHAGTERALADGTRFWAALAALSAEELVKEILEGSVFLSVALFLVRIGTDGAPPVRVLNGRLGIDVYDARLKLLGNLGEGVRELLRSGNRERSRIRRLLSLFPFDSRRDNRANQNSNGERRQNRKSVGPAIGLETSPKSAFARIHFFLLKIPNFLLYLRHWQGSGRRSPDH